MSGRFGEIKVFSGTSHPKLSNDVCTNLGIELSKAEIFKFENDNTFVRILNNIREQDVFIIQPTDKPTNDNIMELLLCMDAAKRASAGRVTAVIPYFGYGRTDKKDQPRVPISARLIADIITTAGADRILTIDLHAPQIQGFFNIPVDELTAVSIFPCPLIIIIGIFLLIFLIFSKVWKPSNFELFSQISKITKECFILSNVFIPSSADNLYCVLKPLSLKRPDICSQISS